MGGHKLLCLVSTLILQFSILIVNVESTAPNSAGTQCQTIGKCGVCIRTAGCVWCRNPKFTEPGNSRREYSRCNTLEAHTKLGICGDAFYENPKHQVTIETMKPEIKSKFQLSPHNAEVTLRVGVKVNLTMEYFDTENKPLDLYYVMDLSATMADDKPRVATLGTRLARKIKNLTSDVRIGFGSFIDKPIIPFVSMDQLNREETENTTSPYGFRNHLKLTTDIDRFREEVKKAKISANIDAPEGGLDAIMQAVSCKDAIGWRDSARHLLIVSTDGPFHIAGDARLGGVLTPNDAQCHMDENGTMYTHAAVQDYPSVSQINAKVQQENVFVIFAVTEENLALYEMLSTHIDGSVTSALKDDSGNVVEIVEAEYKKIISSVELPKLPSQFSSFLRVTYYAKCSNEGPFVKENKCRDLKVGANATFQVELEVFDCPKNPRDWNQTIVFSPVGLPEKFTVKLSMLCQCHCENTIDEGYEENDQILCEGKGTPKCGICECNRGHRGKNCQCSATGSEVPDDDEISCQPTNSTLTCSGRGTCICGQCECKKSEDGKDIYSGVFCECDDSSCPRGENELLCSGNGECKCGECVCNEFYKGESCGCVLREIDCRETSQDISCNGRGQCACGKCLCDHPYSGRFCQNCPNCPDKCESVGIISCLSCYIKNNRGRNGKSKCQECDHLSRIDDRDEVFEESDEEKLCTYRDEVGCESSFVYGYIGTDRHKLQIKLERSQRCPSELPIVWIVSGVVGSVLLAGFIALFCWKIVVLLHDIREVERFEKEKGAEKWVDGGNPIYKQATMTFQNPAYKT